MPSLRRKSRFALAASLLALASVSAQAEIVMLQGTQGPKPDLNSVPPPELQSSITNAVAAFTQSMTSLGGTEFEGSGPQLSFDYGPVANPGTATISGAQLVDGNTATPANGRYNTTTGLSSTDGGHFLESSTSFVIQFTQAISAFSFFMTDLGDFDGQVFLELYAGDPPPPNDNTAPLFRSELINNAGVNPNSNSRIGGNGNLLFAGVTSSTAGVTFRSARFVVNQCDPDLSQTDSCEPNSPDIIGLDSITVGNYRAPATDGTIPEPTSLALVGLGLLAAGFSRKAKRAA